MSFLSAIMDKLGVIPDSAVGLEHFSVFDGRYAYVEGHRGLERYSEEEVVIRFKKKKLIITGTNLRIKEINPDELFIVGEVLNISKEDDKLY